MRASSRRSAVLIAQVLIAGTLLAGGATASAAVPVPAAPVLGSLEGLDSVFCTSATSCWTVGTVENSHGAFINSVLHRTDKKWSKVTVPSPGGTSVGDSSELAAVRCTSAMNCWAVGNYNKKDAVLDEALHWTGGKWFLVSTPTPGGTLTGGLNSLLDVACTAATSCWATGDYGSTSPPDSRVLNLALHWNGHTWSQVSTPNPGGPGKNIAHGLAAVRCTSKSDCWAAGIDGNLGVGGVLRNQMLHWNGRKWSAASVPNPAGTSPGHDNVINSLACTSANSCWAVGFYGPTSPGVQELNQILHWNGRKWHKVGADNPDGTGTTASNNLIAVSCTSARDCWAVGRSGNVLGGEAGENQALHWTGARWLAVPVPQPGGTAPGDLNMLNGVRCTSAASCWAVGNEQQSGKSSQHEILRWNGAKWVTS